MAIVVRNALSTPHPAPQRPQRNALISHLWHWRKKNGMPLGVSTQRARLGTLKDFFAWLEA